MMSFENPSTPREKSGKGGPVQHEQQHRDWTRKAWIATILLVMTVICLILAHMNSCAGSPKKTVVLAPPPPGAPPASEPTSTAVGDCGDLGLGGTREDGCPAGETGRHTTICTPRGLETAVDNCAASPPAPLPAGCAAPGAVTFATVKPLVDQRCVSCHPGFDSYATAKAKADLFIARTAPLGDGNPIGADLHMPKNGGQLAAGDLKMLSDWKAGGLCPAPDPQAPGTTANLSFTALEDALVADGTAIEPRLRTHTGWVVAPHKVWSAGDLALWREAAEKAINSISTDQRIHRLTEVRPGILRIDDLRDFGIDDAKWALIEAADQLDLESFTSRGQILKLLTGHRKPWFHIDIWNDTTLRNATVYYALQGLPSTFPALMQQQGVRYAQDLANFDAALAGFNGSRLSADRANRLVSWHESASGNCFTTYDTGPLDTPQKNLFNFPLLPDSGGALNTGAHVFQFRAGETICTKSNGLHLYYLSTGKDTFRDAPGQHPGQPGRRIFVRSDLDGRLDKADPAIVHDYTSNPNSPTILAGVSCFRCHQQGMLGLVDQVRTAVSKNGGAFAADAQVILAAYHQEDLVGQKLQEENAAYANALEALDIDVNAPIEAVSAVNDDLLASWTLEKLAAYVGRGTEEMRELIGQSTNAQAQIGQILTPNGSVTYDQIVQSFPVLKNELRLFQDPLSL